MKNKSFIFVLMSIFLFLSNAFALTKKDTNDSCNYSSSSEILLEYLYDFYYEKENYKETFNCAFILSDVYDEREGYYWLGQLYYYGQGVEVDLKKSYEYSKIAADKGDSYAYYDLGSLHYNGGNPLIQTDYKKAYEYLHKSFHELGNFDALGELVNVTYYGIGTEKNYEESFKLLNRYDISMLSNYKKLMLAEHYIRGVGTRQNIEYGVSILESLIEEGYRFAEIELNLLYGTNYKDKDKRQIKSLYFYQKDRAVYMPFGYLGFEKQGELSELMNVERSGMKSANYAIDLINSYISNGSSFMTMEVCYALGNIGYIQHTFEPFPDDKFAEKLFEYHELAYQKNCGDNAASNYVNSIIWDTDNPDYQKALQICLDDIKNYAMGVDCIGYIGLAYKEGKVYDRNLFNAYVLMKFELENELVSLSADISWLQDHIKELTTNLSDDELLEADNIVSDINKNFEKIFPYLYNSVDEKYIDTLKVNEQINVKADDNLIPEYQKEILNSRSSDETQKVSLIFDDRPPEIEIDKELKIEGDVVSINFQVSDDSNIEAVFIDNQPVRIKESNNGLEFVNVTYYVGDKNKELIITAFDKWGNTSNKSLTLEKTQESYSINYGDYYALVIGNNNYKYLPKLRTAVNDARVLADILDTKYKFKEVVLLEDATRNEILTELYKFKKKLSFQDNFLIYYAGHGEIDRQLNEGYWQPINSEPDVPIEWIDNNTITSIVRSTKSKHVLIVADSCYSGLLSRGSASQDEVYDNREIYLERMSNKKSRIVLASGGKELVSDGGGGEHSIFAKAFIEILNSSSNEITISEISKNVITNVLASNSDQTPEYSPLHKSGHDGGEFIFVPN